VAVVSAGGLFMTIEGGEGAGKSTQARLLAGRLEAAGARVTLTREPGGTAVGDEVRRLLLDPDGEMSPTAELLLYEASRAELVAAVIAPALAGGGTVLCDRFCDSTIAYQAFGRGLGEDVVRALNVTATGGLRPDLTVYLALPVEEAVSRARSGGADRIEGEPLEFHRRVIAGFEAIAAAEPERVLRVDASGDAGAVSERVWAAVSAHPAMRAMPPRAG
jgi:dTMP kinase